MDTKIKREKRLRRRKRTRAKIFGTSKIPRLCVFRSPRHIYTQLIDDEKAQTLVAANDLELKKSSRHLKKGKINQAFEVGKLIAKKAIEKKIKKVVFDRDGYKYHGRVKAVAEGARKGGLKF